MPEHGSPLIERLEAEKARLDEPMVDVEPREIFRQIDRTHAVLDHLEVKVAHLEDRLGPIRSPFTSGIAMSDDGQAKLTRSPTAERINQAATRLERLCQRVDIVLGDLEI